MRNSELAKKLKARTANSSIQSDNEKTGLLKGQLTSSSDNPNEHESDPYKRFAFLAPFRACQSPEIGEAWNEITPPSSFGGRRRDYPMLNPSTDAECNEIARKSVSKGSLAGNIRIVDKPKQENDNAVGTSPPRSPQRKSKQRPSQTATEEVAENSGIERKLTAQASVADSSLVTCETTESSVITCAPSSVIISDSTSATCPSRWVYNHKNTTESSVITCAPSSVIISASTSATCPSRWVDAHRENKNMLKLSGNLDDDRRIKANIPCVNTDEGKRTRTLAGANNPPKWQSWKLSPFQMSRKGKKTHSTQKDISNEATTIRNKQQLQGHQQGPVDLDEVSVDSNDPSEEGYYSDPTNAVVRHATHLQQMRHTDQSLDMMRYAAVDRSFPSNVLSQLGMDVGEGDSCIEGAYVTHERRAHRRVGSGKWNYHQKRPGNGNGVLKQNIADGKSPRGKLGETLKGSMKKIGMIMKSDDEDSIEQLDNCKKQQRRGSKVVSILRGHNKAIPQTIALTPTQSEDPETNMTHDDLELMHRWQNARVRSTAVTPDAPPYHNNKPRHKRDESEVFSVAASSVSEGTALVDNRSRALFR